MAVSALRRNEWARVLSFEGYGRRAEEGRCGGRPAWMKEMAWGGVWEGISAGEECVCVREREMAGT